MNNFNHSALVHYREITICCENGIYRMWGDPTPFLSIQGVQNYIDEKYQHNLDEIMNRIKVWKDRDCNPDKPLNEKN